MKKLKLLVFLFLLVFAQKVYCGQNNAEQSCAPQNNKEDKLCFENTDLQLYDFGDLPSAQVFFNVIPEARTSFSTNGKSKELYSVLAHSKTKINFNLSIHQATVFSRYSSAFIHIFLKTACLRL